MFILLNSITIYLSIYRCYLLFLSIYCQVGCQGWRGWLSWDDWTRLRRTPYWHWLDARCRVTWEIPVRPVFSLCLLPLYDHTHSLPLPFIEKKTTPFFFHSQIYTFLLSIFCIIIYLPSLSLLFSPLLPLYRSPFPSLSPSFLSPLSSPLSFHTLR